MARQNERETGARKLEPRRGPDPSDAFSQDAAGNKPPKNGMGLTAPLDENPAEMRQSDALEESESAMRDGTLPPARPSVKIRPD